MLGGHRGVGGGDVAVDADLNVVHSVMGRIERPQESPGALDDLRTPVGGRVDVVALGILGVPAASSSQSLLSIARAIRYSTSVMAARSSSS